MADELAATLERLFAEGSHELTHLCDSAYLRDRLTQQQKVARMLVVDNAYHSPHMIRPAADTTPKFYSAGGTGRGPEAPTHAGKIMESFVMRLEAHLNCQREELNLYDLWASTGSVQPPRVVWPVAAGSDANMRAISNLFNGLSVNGGPFPLFDANAALAEEAIGG
ncbi:polyketide synthase 4 [Apiospora saccharicola]